MDRSKRSSSHHLGRFWVRNGFTKGHELNQFEDNFKNWIGAGFCTGVGSGHDALVLGLQACGLKKGQKVIAPAMTFHFNHYSNYSSWW